VAPGNGHEIQKILRGELHLKRLVKFQSPRRIFPNLLVAAVGDFLQVGRGSGQFLLNVSHKPVVIGELRLHPIRDAAAIVDASIVLSWITFPALWNAGFIFTGVIRLLPLCASRNDEQQRQ
jgi:hypothetical protein